MARVKAETKALLLMSETARKRSRLATGVTKTEMGKGFDRSRDGDEKGSERDEEWR